MDTNARIVTHYIRPPVPSKKYDWCAYRDGYDAGDPIGYGETEQEATDDLLEQEGNRT